jgi:hypothetical protein
MIKPLTLSELGHMAAIVLRAFSGNFTGSETHAVKNSEEVLSYPGPWTNSVCDS